MNLAFYEGDFFSKFDSCILSFMEDLLELTKFEKAHDTFVRKHLGAKRVSKEYDDIFTRLYFKAQLPNPHASNSVTLLDCNYQSFLVYHDRSGRYGNSKRQVQLSQEIVSYFWDRLDGEQKALISESLDAKPKVSVWIWPEISSWEDWSWTKSWYEAIRRAWRGWYRNLDPNFSPVSSSQLKDVLKSLDKVLILSRDEEFLSGVWSNKDPKLIVAEWHMAWFLISYLVFLEERFKGFSFYMDRSAYRIWKDFQPDRIPPFRSPWPLMVELPYGPFALSFELIPERFYKPNPKSGGRPPFPLEVGNSLAYVSSSVLIGINLIVENVAS